MCIIFPGEDSRLLTVAGTKVFVAALADGRQLTVYENAVAQEKVTEGAAMVLPVPLGHVKFLDFSEGAEQAQADAAYYASFYSGDLFLVPTEGGSTDHPLFKALRSSFPTLTDRRAREPEREEEEEDMGFDISAGFDDDAKLVVRDVGSYRVSLAPCLSDLKRIDPQTFVVPPAIEQLLSTHYSGGREPGESGIYEDEAGDFSFVVCRFKDADVPPHPIGYVHERLADGRLFVPTRHAHGCLCCLCS